MAKRRNKKLTFKPYIPAHFDGTLILGESSYMGPDKDSPLTGWRGFDKSYPLNFIIAHVKENADLDLATFRTLRESFKPTLSPKEFWARKAFTNFIPELLKSRMAKDRPTKEQWAAGREQFDMILDEVSPCRILVVGYGLWENLPEGQNETGDRCFFRDSILAMCIPSPSSWNRKGYTINDAHKITARLMKHNNICS